MSAPTVTSFTPASGVHGQNVTLTGTNFTGSTAVAFNGVAAEFTVVSNTTIIASVPPGDPATVTGTIAVTNGSGTGTSAGTFTDSLLSMSGVFDDMVLVDSPFGMSSVFDDQVTKSALLSGSDRIIFTETFRRGGTFNLSGSDRLATRDGLVKTSTQSDVLAPVDSYSRVGGGSFTDHLVPVDSGSVQNIKSRSDVLVATDSGSAAGSIKTLRGSDLLAATDGGLATSSAKQRCYEPYIISPALGTRESFVLTFPFTVPTLTVTLKVPLFGNMDASETGLQVRRTVGNQLSTARGASWPTIRRGKFNFSALTASQRDSFVAFCILSAGKEIGLLDQEDRQWRGVIVGKIETSQVGLGCDYACSFEFQGSLA